MRRAGGGYRRRHRVAGGSGGTADGAGVSHRPAAGLLSQQKIFSAENLYESIWEEPYFYSCKNTVMVHIRNIRQKVGAVPSAPCGG